MQCTKNGNMQEVLPLQSLVTAHRLGAETIECPIARQLAIVCTSVQLTCTAECRVPFGAYYVCMTHSQPNGPGL